jgi:hypothetical protein
VIPQEGLQDVPTTDSDVWQRLGNLLMRRRIELDPRYKNRTLFTAERGVEYRIVNAIERGERSNYDQITITSLEVAYGLAPGAVSRYLAEVTDRLELLSDAGPPTAPPAEGSPRHNFPEREDISPARIAPYVALVRQDLAAAIVRYGTGHTGAQAFSAPYEAAVWDRVSMPASDREELIALFRLFADEGTGTGGEGSETGLWSALPRNRHNFPDSCWNPHTSQILHTGPLSVRALGGNRNVREMRAPDHGTRT